MPRHDGPGSALASAISAASSRFAFGAGRALWFARPSSIFVA